MTELLARAFGPWVRQVGPATLRADLIAGILGALLVLPQGFAFAALAAALLFGAGTPVAKLLLAHTSPWMLAALLYLGSARRSCPV
jgi:MFS superfamily sulfate permease-like transporter